MRKWNGQALRLGCAGAALLTTMSMASAGGFAIREQSAYGQGSSFAGIAAGGSLSSMFWNPATLADVEGIEIEEVVSGIAPFSDVNIVVPPVGSTFDEGDIAQNALVPAGYGAYRLTDRLVLGVGINTPFGLVTQYENTSPVHAAGVAGTSKVFSINVNPAAAYQVTDWLALALGAQVQYIDIRLTRQFLGTPPAGFGISTIEGDDIGFGLTAGVQVTPLPGTEVGLGYRSRINHEIDGEVKSVTLGANFDATGEDFDLPDLVTFGIRQRLTDRFRVMAGAEWSNWSQFEQVNLQVAGATIPLSFDYEDGWFFSLGGEYDITPQLTVRAGVGYELSPLDEDNRTFRLPDSDRLWISAGASYKANERWSVDAGYTFISAEDADLLAAGAGGGPDANGPFSGDAEAHVHILSAAVKVKFGGPAAPAMDAIVTK